MANQKYIVKSLTPWMMDELLAISQLVKYDLILLRNPEEFYNDILAKIELNGVHIYVKPYSYNHFLKKLYVCFQFIFSNLLKFDLKYNTVLGFKSVFWFLKIDIELFSEGSNMHAQFATQPSLIAYLIKKYYDNSPAMSFTFHAYDIYFNNKWFKLLVENSKKAFSISNFNINYVKRKFVDSDQIVLSRLGVFRSAIHKTNHAPTKYFELGLMSWFIEKKGITYLLEAMKQLKEKGYENIRLNLAGDGPLKDKIIDFVKKNELNGMVELKGKIKAQQKEDFYNSLDAFILPSVKLKNDQDGIPVVLMEAIAYSLPIISTNVSGIPEICIDNYNGKLISERNVNDIQDAIIHFVKNKSELSNYSDNSLALSEAYDIEINTRNKIIQMGWLN